MMQQDFVIVFRKNTNFIYVMHCLMFHLFTEAIKKTD